MIKLITVENDKPVFSPEVRMFAPLRKIVERDKGSKGDHDGRKKYIATKELAFVYFYADPRPGFTERYKDVKLRIDKIKIKLDLPEDWFPDEIIDEAITFYLADLKDDQDLQLLDAAASANSKTKDWLNNVDYTLMDAKTKKPAYDPLHVQKVNAVLSSSIEAVKSLREKVSKSIKLNDKIRGGGVKGRFEDNDD